MILYVEPPAFGLLSGDAESLAAIAYCSLVAPDSFSVNYSGNASSLCTGYLPSLKEDSADAWASGFEGVVAQLRQSGLDADEMLGPVLKAQITAYSALITSKASDLTCLSLFGDPENYDNFTRKALGQKLSFPQNYTRPTQRHRQAIQRLEEMGFDLHADEASQGLFLGKRKTAFQQQARQIRIQKMADELYSILETKLRNGPFLFGNKPSSIDCLVFGNLSMHLFPAVPNNFLALRLKESFPRTWKFVVDFNAQFIDHRPIEIVRNMPFSLRKALTTIWHELLLGVTPGDKSESDSEEQAKTPSEWQAKTLFLGGVLTVLVGFALFNKLIVVATKNDDLEEFMDSEAYALKDETEAETDDI